MNTYSAAYKVTEVNIVCACDTQQGIIITLQPAAIKILMKYIVTLRTCEALDEQKENAKQCVIGRNKSMR